MIQRLDLITPLVRDLDEAARFCTVALGSEERPHPATLDGCRRVRAGVHGQAGAALTCQPANTAAKRPAVGRQAAAPGAGDR